jgi:hypothetical protein
VKKNAKSREKPSWWKMGEIETHRRLITGLQPSNSTASFRTVFLSFSLVSSAFLRLYVALVINFNFHLLGSEPHGHFRQAMTSEDNFFFKKKKRKQKSHRIYVGFFFN